MIEPLYTIKPLEWKLNYFGGEPHFWHAKGKPFHVSVPAAGGRWHMEIPCLMCWDDNRDCTAEEAKAAAEAHYRQQVEALLVPARTVIKVSRLEPPIIEDREE